MKTDFSQTLFDRISQKVPELKFGADEWVLKMMEWHFSDDTGSRFWLQKKADLGFDPLNDIKCLNDIQKFGLFDKQSLRTCNVSDLVPRGFTDRKRRVFETGGSSGAPCRIIDITRGKYDVSIYRGFLEERGHAHGNVLAMTPGGPHAYGTFVKRLADTWQGNVASIDFDPRYVKLLERNRQDPGKYIGHLIDQTTCLLESQAPNILFTTSKLLSALVVTLPQNLKKYGVNAVCTGGTSCTSEEENFLRNTYLDDIDWIDTYGNTLMGHALQGDPWAANADKAYYLPPPQAHIKLVEPGDWTQEVPDGKRGQVLVITLHEDMFIPNILERDSAVRMGAHPSFPFPGIGAIAPIEDGSEVTEGVY